LAERALAKMIAASQAKHAAHAARQAAGRAGRPPVPVEQNARVRQQQVRLEKARASAAERAFSAAAERGANITDPQSRIKPLRGGGWLQGYYGQAVTAADRDDALRRRLLIAGENLTAPGPDRLIATGTARELHTAATDSPAEGPPPDDSDPIEAMFHRCAPRKESPPTASDPTSPKPRSGTPNTTSASDGSPAAWAEPAANGTSTPPSTTSARSSATSPEHHCPPNHNGQQHQPKLSTRPESNSTQPVSDRQRAEYAKATLAPANT
jgi:hypothetical protein